MRLVRAQRYFVKGLIEIPLIGSDEVFSWGVWVSLSRESSSRASDRWDRAGREAERPYFGRLTTDLPVYATTTLNLKTRVHTQPVGERPFVELEPTDHPLAIEQRTGIGLERGRSRTSPQLCSLGDPLRHTSRSKARLRVALRPGDRNHPWLRHQAGSTRNWCRQHQGV